MDSSRLSVIFLHSLVRFFWFQSRMAIYSKSPAGVSLMSLYNYAEQRGKETWTKIDFRKLPLSGLSNENEYNAVSTSYTKHHQRLHTPPRLHSASASTCLATGLGGDALCGDPASCYAFVVGIGFDIFALNHLSVSDAQPRFDLTSSDHTRHRSN